MTKNDSRGKLQSDIIDLSNLQIIFDVMHDGIMIVDKDIRIVYYNHAMEKIEGLKSGEVLGKPYLEVFPFQAYEKSTILQAISEGTPFDEFIQTYVTSKGKTVTSITSTMPIRVGDDIVGAVEITKDISKVRELTEKVIELQNTLFQSGQEQKDRRAKKNGCYYCFNDIISQDSSLIKTIEFAKKASHTNSTVMICGETGTGKEMYAQSIHNHSYRCDQPFIAINCAALPGELLEGILFGTVRGGFTGSIDRPGVFEQANGGTLLLDEIDSMDRNLQAKLLRVLQEGYVRRVGDTKEIKLDIRLISTSNSNLIEGMEKGTFRRDLYYRLSVVNITIPPLRERKNDILLLADFFVREYNAMFLKGVKGFSPEAVELLEGYYWPGNVRELKHCIEGIMNIIGNEDIIRVEHMPSSITNSFQIQESFTETPVASPPLNGLTALTNSIEKNNILEALTETKGNVSEAAALLGIKRQVLQYKMKKFGINREKYTITWHMKD